MSNQISLFENSSFGSVRVIMRGNDPWFVAKDVAVCLGYADPRRAVYEYCKKAESIESIGEGNLTSLENSGSPVLDPQTKIIPESDLYRLIMRSHLPNAEAFQDWVVEDVLPSIRKTGEYVVETPRAKAPGVDSTQLLLAIFQAAKIEGNQLALALDKVFVRENGYSALKTAEVQLIAPQQQQLYTPTEIGKSIEPPCSAVKVNKYLEAMGWQIKANDKWEAVNDGVPYAVYLDTGKAHSDGTPIRQMKWTADVIFAIQAYLINGGN